MNGQGMARPKRSSKAAEVRKDQRFTHGPGQAMVHLQGTSNGMVGSHNKVGGNLSIKNRQFHIGRFQFGTGGLVSGIVAIVVVFGGTAAAVIDTTQVELTSAVGRWELAGGSMIPGVASEPTILTVSANGQFTFDAGMSVDPALAGAAGSTGLALPDMRVSCTGTVEPDGNHFTFRTSAGPCGTFDGSLSANGNVMDVAMGSGSNSNALSLTKTAS